MNINETIGLICISMQMLTCINPTVSFTMKDATHNIAIKHNGVAVALKWLCSLVKQFGGTHPPEGRVRQEIRILGIGDISDGKQHFNKYANEKNI